MKVLSALLAILLPAAALYAQTSEDEYTYLTQGYEEQLASGNAAKQGYHLEDLHEYTVAYTDFSRITNFVALYRDGEDVPCALLMTFERTGTGYMQYVCIPAEGSSQALWDKARNHYWQVTTEWEEPARAYSWAMVKMLSYTLTAE